MSIYINNSILSNQPSSLLEELLQIQSDNEAINGGLQRNKSGQKKQSTMQFTNLSPSDYQTLVNYFTTGSGVIYYNDQSSYGIFTFSGLPYFDEAQYVKGASLYRPLRVRIREY